MNDEQLNERAKQIGDLFCGNGRCHNQQVADVAALLKKWDAPADLDHHIFELSAAASAHQKYADRMQFLADLRRVWAAERGPVWQRYLAAGLKMGRSARIHRDRAKELNAKLLELVTV